MKGKLQRLNNQWVVNFIVTDGISANEIQIPVIAEDIKSISKYDGVYWINENKEVEFDIIDNYAKIKTDEQ